MSGKQTVSRRTVLGATAAGITGAAALSGTAAAHDVTDPTFTTTDLNIREGPGLGYDVIRTAEKYTGLQIEDGPWDNDGYRWWYFDVNGDGTNSGRTNGYAVQKYTAHADFIHPCYGQITSTYWDCRDGCDRYHRALDIANDKYTDIGAARHGHVSHVGWISGYGKTIIIDHESGYQTLYAHLNDYTVVEGEDVVTGEHIGYMGNTGDSSGDHLHFEIRKDGEKKNWDMDKYAYVWLYAGIGKDWPYLDPCYL